MPFVTAEAKVAGRRFLQLVHIISTAISHLDVHTPSTAIIAPVEAHFSGNYTISLLGMFALHPSRGVCATTLSRDTRVGHLGACISHKLVPLSDGWQMSAVAFKTASPQVA